MPETKIYREICKFCTRGSQENRGVLEIKKNDDDQYQTYKYECALGELGKGCIIPSYTEFGLNVEKNRL